jgi:hypothetical protein
MTNRLAAYGGAANALETLLDHWTDDNNLNRLMVEVLLFTSREVAGRG